MNHQHRAQDKKTAPNQCEYVEVGVEDAFFFCYDITEQDHRQTDNHIRSERVCGSHVDLKEPALAIHQGRDTPVGGHPDEKRHQDTEGIQPNTELTPSGVIHHEVREPAVPQMRENGKDRDGVRCSQRTALLMREVPESVEGMKDHVKCIPKRLFVVRPRFPVEEPCDCGEELFHASLISLRTLMIFRMIFGIKINATKARIA